MKEPVLQVALDFLELDRARKAAREAVEGGANWVEAGTPLIKSEGLDSVRALREAFPEQTIVADMKVMDAGRIEMEAAAKAGADAAMVLGAATDSTIEECVRAGENYGFRVGVDLVGLDNPVRRAREVEELGASYVSVHIPIDDQMKGVLPLELFSEIREAVDLPVAVAGGINSETAGTVVEQGADVVVVGGAIIKADDAREAARTIRSAMESGASIETDLYKRVTDEDVEEVFRKVSTPNLSDALHRGGHLEDVEPVTRGRKMAGPAFTVRTYPGDWAKPVEAISEASDGAVLVIDAGGVRPAVWGELATESCLQQGIEGVVIHGTIRDIDTIRQLEFSAFATHVSPTAGEPKGFGEMNVPVHFSGRTIHPGDWLVGDDNGVVVVPERKKVEIANRAMDVLEKENRLRSEIRDGDTLGDITELVKWEKQIAEDASS